MGSWYRRHCSSCGKGMTWISGDEPTICPTCGGRITKYPGTIKLWILSAIILIIIAIVLIAVISQIQLANPTQKNESMISDVSVLYPDRTCQIDSPRVG